MADRETDVIARIAPGIAGVDAAKWDQIAGDHPFTSHAFLAALERSGSVGRGTGWTPAPILVEDESGELAAAEAHAAHHTNYVKIWAILLVLLLASLPALRAWPRPDLHDKLVAEGERRHQPRPPHDLVHPRSLTPAPGTRRRHPARRSGRAPALRDP